MPDKYGLWCRCGYRKGHGGTPPPQRYTMDGAPKCSILKACAGRRADFKVKYRCGMIVFICRFCGDSMKLRPDRRLSIESADRRQPA